LNIKIKGFSHLIAIALVGTAALSGCQSAEKKTVSGNQSPRALSVDFFPPTPHQGESIIVSASGKDEEGDAIVYRYTWFVNKKSVHETRELPPSLFKRGDKISVEVIPNDGLSDGVVFKSSEIRVQNTPPEILSIQLLPQPFQPGETIKAIVTGKDREGDLINYTYEWKKNGVLLFLENRAEAKIPDLQRGDHITVMITPHDGRNAGKSIESLHLKSENRRPVITSNPPHQFKHGVYSYPVQAFDPDGDVLHYMIEDPQVGMHLDTITGLFHWDIPKHTSGVHHIILRVQDSEGEMAAQKVRLDIDFLRKNS